MTILYLVMKMDILLNKKKNLIAKNLRSSKYRSKIVKPKKGKGSFKRKKN
jgi:alternative ribosome-rescue factor